MSKNSDDILTYSLVTGIIAMFVFGITAGFSIRINLRTCVYAAIYALLIFANYFFSVLVFKFMGIAEKTFICSGLSIIATAAVGCIAFSESFTLRSAAQIGLVLATLLAVFLPNAKKGTKNKSITAIGLLFCVFTTVLAVGCNTLTKYFALDTNVTNENSFFFLTNAFIVVFSLICVTVRNKFSVKSIARSFTAISLQGYLMIIINVISSNVTSVLFVLVLRKVDLLVFSPLNSALALLAGEVVAVFIAKEKPRIVATILALSSVLVVLLF